MNKTLCHLCSAILGLAPILQAQQVITKLRVINADNNQPLVGYDPLVSGAVIDLETLPTRNLSIEAITDPDPVGSVRFAYDGNPDFKTETVRPYAFFGDTQGSFHAWTPEPGSHTVQATPYTGGGASGTAGTPLSINFTVVDGGGGGSNPTSGTYLQANGLVVMEIENTPSPYDLWLKKTSISGFTGSGYLDFNGNTTESGPATSPLEFKFKINQSGLHYLHLYCARETVGGRTDVANDCYVRVEGDYSAGPDAGNSHGDDAPLSLLKSDTKFYGGNHHEFVWASGNRLDPGGDTNKRVAIYDFKAGQEYKLVVSGRSKLFKIDRIVFRHANVTSGTAQNINLPESEKISIPNHSYSALDDFPIIDAGEVAYKKVARYDALEIDASVPANRDKFGRADRFFDGVDGSYAVKIITLTEEDGESTYRLLVNGSVVASYQNPLVGVDSPLDLEANTHTWSDIKLRNGDQISVESNTHTNGLIPENGGTAWARGRWRLLELFLQSRAAAEGPPAGRLAVVTDGNAHDPDDVAATPIVLAMLRAKGVANRLVHYNHSCELRNKPIFNQAGGDTEQLLRQEMNQISCDGTASRWGGFDHLTFWNCRTQWDEAVADLRADLNASTAADPLWIIEAGEPDVIYEAAIGANPGVMQHVYIITHHPNNDIGKDYDLDDVLSLQSPGASVVRISDQNTNLKNNLSDWHWARDHADPRVNWLWERGKFAADDAFGEVKFKFPAIAGKFDCSDAGMTLYWLTGATSGGLQNGGPAEIEQMLNTYIDGGIPLTAHAGPDQSVMDADADGSHEVTLDGSLSMAADAPITSYVWTEGATTLATGETAEVTLDLGKHIINLTVIDETGAKHRDTVVITVTEFSLSSGPMFGDPADATPRGGTAVMDSDSDSLIAGRTFSADDRSAICVFELPDLGMVDDPFASSSFEFYFEDTRNMAPTEPSVDLYGLGSRAARTVLNSDYYTGVYGGDTTDAIPLQQGILTPTSATGATYRTDSVASAGLLEYLNDQYAGGEGAGQFIFLRFSMSAAVGTDVRYTITSGDGGVPGPPDTRPRIIYQVLPDLDRDGMPDTWEIQMFRSKEKTGSGDEDGDGQSNESEYIAGTDPGDGSSRLQVGSIVEMVPGSRNFTLRWASVLGRTYLVRKSTILSGDWLPASSRIAGTGSELTFEDVSNPEPSCFYRIEVTIP
ncbi:PKD domain-containing protein [Haloferula sp.]|uniref:PKD domain-containing protein n=1 Tax=Haloferula sp. TaxID=2497595 RepID=UPI003C7804B9